MRDRKNDFAVLYYNPKRRRFLIVSVAQDGLARVEIGRPREISDSTFNSEIRDIVFWSTRFIQKNVYSSAQARGGTYDENRRFVSERLSVHIERLPLGDLIVKPLHHQRSGYVEKAKEHILIEQKSIEADLSVALQRAFKIAT